MPIFDQGYQHWDGKLTGHAWRWFAIARRGVRTQIKNRWTRMALLLAWLPAIALGGFLAVWGLLEQQTEAWGPFFQQFLPPQVLLSPKEFRSEVWTLAFSWFLQAETYAAMILVVIIGPNLISQDLRFNAIPLYLSRPLTRFDYFVGKLGTIAAFLTAVMIVPAMLTYLLGLAFSLSIGVVADTWRLVPACVAFGAVVVGAAGLFMLAISSLSKNSRYVAAVWIGLWMVGSTSANILTALQVRWGPIVSMTNSLGRIREELLGTREAFESIQDAGERMMSEGMNMGRPSLARALLGRPQRPPRRPPRPRPIDPDAPRFNPFAQDYPWQWSAYMLSSLMGISLWTLTSRVKSLDRLR